MQHILATLVLAAMSTAGFCAEWGGLHTKDAKDKSLAVEIAQQGYEENEKNHFAEKFSIYDITVYKQHPKYPSFSSGLNRRIYKNIKCRFRTTNQLPRKYSFICEKKQGYPLSGAVYKGYLPIAPPSTTILSTEEEYQQCLSGEFDPIYTCVSGCKNSPLTPKRLFEPPYECE